MTPTQISYGKYIIKVGKLSNRWTARAFHHPPTSSRGIAAEAVGESSDQAVIAVKERLDAIAGAHRAARRYDERSGFDVPSAEEYAAALAHASLAAAQIAMLKAHAAAGEIGLAAGELAHAAGYTDYSSANVHYGKCGRLLAEVMNVRVPDSELHDNGVPTGVLAWEGATRPNGEFVWVMYPELRQAVEEVLV